MNFTMRKRLNIIILQAQEDADDLEEIALRLTTLYLEQERYEDILEFAEQEVDNALTRWNLARAYQALEIWKSRRTL